MQEEVQRKYLFLFIFIRKLRFCEMINDFRENSVKKESPFDLSVKKTFSKNIIDPFVYMMRLDFICFLLEVFLFFL